MIKVDDISYVPGNEQQWLNATCIAVIDYLPRNDNPTHNFWLAGEGSCGGDEDDDDDSMLTVCWYIMMIYEEASMPHIADDQELHRWCHFLLVPHIGVSELGHDLFG